jgi:hypothetical protein
MCRIFCGLFKNNETFLLTTLDVVQYILDSSVAIKKMSRLSITFNPKSSLALWLLNQSLQVQDINEVTTNGN